MFENWLNERKERILHDFEELISIPSISVAAQDAEKPYGASCAQIAEKAADLAESYGLSVCNEENRYLLLSCGDLARKSREIGLFCHLDVVPAGDNWTFEPFALTRKNGFFIGRGVGDNKGASLLALHLLSYLRQNPLQNFSPFVFLGLNEEAGMSDIKTYLKRHREPEFALVPDVELPLCIGEKSRFVFTLSGRLQLNCRIQLMAGVSDNVIPQTCEAVVKQNNGQERRFTAQAAGGHAAFPQKGAYAIELLLRKLKNDTVFDSMSVQQFNELLNLSGQSDGSQLSCAYSDANGEVLTMVCTRIEIAENGAFECLFDCRFPTTLAADDLERRLEQAAAEKGLDWKLKIKDVSKDKYFEPELLCALTDIARQYTGRNDAAYRMGGGTYARHLSKGIGYGIGQVFERPCFIAPGQGGAHQADECIPEKQLWDGFQILHDALRWLDENYK